MVKSDNSPQSPPEAPKIEKNSPESPPEAPQTSPPEKPKTEDSPPEALKDSLKIENKSPPEKPKKRKQSPSQLANLKKGRNVKSLEAPPETLGANNKTMLYVGIGIGVIASSFGIFKLYQMWKNREKKPKLESPNQQVLSKEEQKKAKEQIEKLRKIEEAKKNFEQ